jgi:hypothetical protein
METIERYIQFAIDNGYNTIHEVTWIVYNTPYSEKVRFLYWREHYNEEHLLELITSKDYIEAIARGIEKTTISYRSASRVLLDYETHAEMPQDVFIDLITWRQAIAIRDNELETFITNILPKQ